MRVTLFFFKIGLPVTYLWGQEVYAYGYNETVIIDSYIKNIGEANWTSDRDDMYVKAYTLRTPCS